MKQPNNKNQFNLGSQDLNKKKYCFVSPFVKTVCMLKSIRLLNSSETRIVQRQIVTSITVLLALSFCGVLLCISLEDVLLLCPSIGFVDINSAHVLLLCVV